MGKMKEVGGNCRGYILSSNEKVAAVEATKLLSGRYCTPQGSRYVKKRGRGDVTLCLCAENGQETGAVLCGCD